jgi:hypothetical protein
LLANITYKKLQTFFFALVSLNPEYAPGSLASIMELQCMKYGFCWAVVLDPTLGLPGFK